MATKEEILEKFKQMYQSKLGDPARLGQYLVRLLTDSRVPMSAKMALVGSGLYGLVERDLLSDTLHFIPGVGLADDVVLIVHGVKTLIAQTDVKVAVELWPGDEDSFRRTMTAVAWLDNTLYGNIRNAVMSFFTSRQKEMKIVPWLSSKSS